MTPGREYDPFVFCASCGARRPLHAVEWRHFPKPNAEGAAGEYRCRDAVYCEVLKAEIRRLKEGA